MNVPQLVFKRYAKKQKFTQKYDLILKNFILAFKRYAKKQIFTQKYDLIIINSYLPSKGMQ